MEGAASENQSSVKAWPTRPENYDTLGFLVKLIVHSAAEEDAWKDAVRVREKFRTDVTGNHIERGTICRVSVCGKTRLVVVHGSKDGSHDEKTIHIDRNLREVLDLKKGEEYDFEFRRVGLFGRWTWACTASDPAYRIPAQISVISFILGLIGLVLGFLSLRH